MPKPAPKSAQNAPGAFLGPISPDTELLLLRLDLKTERLLAEVEPLVIANANREATDAAAEDRIDSEQ
jgi:hypothetical protein